MTGSHFVNPSGFPSVNRGGRRLVLVIGRILYDGPLKPPLVQGQQVARLELRVAGQPVYTLPLVTNRAVPAAGPIDRIVKGLLGLLA